jgi:hypothetical protein
MTSTLSYFTTTKLIIISGETNSVFTRHGNTITIAIATCSATIQPDSNGFVPPGSCNAMWNYYPSFAAALLFSILFGVLTIAHIYQAVKHGKKWCWVIIVAGIWETLAFIFRTISTKHQQESGILLVFQIFVLTAPLCKFYSNNDDLPITPLSGRNADYGARDKRFRLHYPWSHDSLLHAFS